MPGRPVLYTLFLSLYLLFPAAVSAQPPAGYYSAADGLTGPSLQQALHDIINDHTVVPYADLPVYFRKTDRKTDGTVWDMYSDIPGGTPPYIFTFGQNECGNYTQEGDCFNREHSFPKSWFNDLSPMYSDLFHIYPTDGWVNNKRGNYPFGVTGNPTWTSLNGSKLGPSSYPGYTGIVFEPVNSYKGDFARSFFYMAVRYLGEDSGWTGSDMVTGSQLKSWALSMLMEWDNNDPVSKKEKDRNDSVYVLQSNRNPFIDNPAYASLIWGTQNGIDYNPGDEHFRIWPVPAKESITIEVPGKWQEKYEIRILDVSAKTVTAGTYEGSSVRLGLADIRSGFYILMISYGSEIYISRIIVMH